ncbi:response regulator transcription factor [Octadecabacter sp. R77987]|uniref:helix-turn-helix transcriptional regulator n=1 Tax=Octadecabacter sp. R77987 TaxID=3093874 RepID=UPI0036706D4F
MFIGSESNEKTESGIFVGSPLDFSDTVLRLADMEMPCLGFSRAASLNELLFISDNRAASVCIIIIDETMMDALTEVMPEMRARFPSANIVMAFRDDTIARRLIDVVSDSPQLGQVALLPMKLHVDSWLSVLRLLVCGENYVPADLVVKAPVAKSPPAPENHAEDAAAVHLTEREMQVLRSAAEGKQNKTIADELKLSQHTVKLHMHHIIAKLGVHNRTEAAVWLLGHGQTGH